MDAVVGINVILRPPSSTPFWLAYVFWWTMTPGLWPRGFRLVFLEVQTLVAPKEGLVTSHSCQIGSSLRNRPHSPEGSWRWLWKLMKEGRKARFLGLFLHPEDNSLGFECFLWDYFSSACDVDSILNTQSAWFSTNLPWFLLGLPWAVLFEETSGIRKDC